MSKLETNTIDNISGSSTLTVGDSNTSTISIPKNITLGASGTTITVPSGATITNNGTQTGFGGTNTPAFLLKQTSQTTIPNSTRTKINIDSAVIDTASGLDATNKRWVVPSGQAGKYFICYSGRFQSATDWDETNFTVRKNGTVEFSVWGVNRSYETFTQSFIIDLSVGDYLEMYAKQNSGSNQTVSVQDQGLQTFLSGYKIIE